MSNYEEFPPDDQLELDAVSDALYKFINEWTEDFQGVDRENFAACLFHHAVLFSGQVADWSEEEMREVLEEILRLVRPEERN